METLIQWLHYLLPLSLVAGAATYLVYKYSGVTPTSNSRPRLFNDVAKVKVILDPALNSYSLYLIAKCDTTASCQFEAARRMQKKNMASTISIVILSLYAILFSLLPSLSQVEQIKGYEKVLGMLSIFMSVSIIAFSLYEMLKRYDLRSVLFLKSARRLQELRDEVLLLHLGETQEPLKYAGIEREYHRILADTDDNHSRLDYDVVRVGEKEIVGIQAAEVTLLRLANVWIAPLLALMAPLIIGALYLFVIESPSVFSHLTP
jgi:hypothetical protein